MIGFEIKANGLGGWSWDRGAWTEGSLMLAKIAITVSGKNPYKGAQQGTLAGIEEGFQTLRVLGFREICGYKWDMTLTVKGDMRFRYDFRHDASVDQTLMELLRKIKNCGEKMRDQVGLYFCAAIRDYRTWTILGRPHGPYAIDMTIDL